MIVWSPGWRSDVALGSAQKWFLEELRRTFDRRRHKSRTWATLRPLRSYGRSASVMHRLVHRFSALGLVAIQTTRGRDGCVRFTFGVRFWKRGPTFRPSIWRIRARVRSIIAPGQVAFGLSTDPPNPRPFIVPEPHGVAPTLFDVCVVCGGRDRVRMGLYRTPEGVYGSGIRCVDRVPCMARAESRP